MKSQIIFPTNTLAIILLIVFNIAVNNSFNTSMIETERSSSVNSNIQSEELDCLDVEETEGAFRTLICVKNGEAYCQIDNWRLPFDTGVCTPGGPIED